MKGNEDGDLENKLRDHLKDVKVADELELNVLAALNQKDLLIKNNTMKTPRFYVLAAVLFGIVVGLAAAFFISKAANGIPPVSQGENKFLLLLHEDSTFKADAEDIPQLIREYSDWATNLSKEGKLLAAEKLTSDHRALGHVSSNNFPVSGYFVILADDLDDAYKIASSHPHIAYNGGIELRPIENLN